MDCTYKRHVLSRLADRTNDKTGVCWPSVGSLARDVCCSTRKVQGVLKELVRHGLVQVERNKGPKGCNIYRLTLSPAPGAPPQVVHPCTLGTNALQVKAPTPARSAPEPKRKQKDTPHRETSQQCDDLLVSAIREGKGYLLKSVSAHKARTLISEGRVSENACKKAGLL